MVLPKFLQDNNSAQKKGEENKKQEFRDKCLVLLAKIKEKNEKRYHELQKVFHKKFDKINIQKKFILGFYAQLKKEFSDLIASSSEKITKKKTKAASKKKVTKKKVVKKAASKTTKKKTTKKKVVKKEAKKTTKKKKKVAKKTTAKKATAKKATAKKVTAKKKTAKTSASKKKTSTKKKAKR
ncbi:MAG: hypothetical protein VXY34_01770 [Bdellovibrionota bacterium]|nr:hypothetical protein [Bdellovibrionota bacterium]